MGGESINELLQPVPGVSVICRTAWRRCGPTQQSVDASYLAAVVRWQTCHQADWHRCDLQSATPTTHGCDYNKQYARVGNHNSYTRNEGTGFMPYLWSLLYAQVSIKPKLGEEPYSMLRVNSPIASHSCKRRMLFASEGKKTERSVYCYSFADEENCYTMRFDAPPRLCVGSLPMYSFDLVFPR